MSPEPCLVHGEALILCPSCEAERLNRMRARIMRKADEAAFMAGNATAWISEQFTITREQLDRLLKAELQ